MTNKLFLVLRTLTLFDSQSDRVNDRVKLSEMKFPVKPICEKNIIRKDGTSIVFSRQRLVYHGEREGG